ncbi:unknown [Prevotella sp. CAG:1124]|nr:unknown [Prevotella sp. CAG:1124]
MPSYFTSDWFTACKIIENFWNKRTQNEKYKLFLHREMLKIHSNSSHCVLYNADIQQYTGVRTRKAIICRH